MGNWSPGGYRSGSRLPPAAKADVERVGRVQANVSAAYVNPTGEGEPSPPRIKKMNSESWRYRIRKDGTRPEGTYERVVWRLGNRFCTLRTEEERRQELQIIRQHHNRPRTPVRS